MRWDITPRTFISVEWNSHRDDRFFGFWDCGHLRALNLYLVSIWIHIPRRADVSHFSRRARRTYGRVMRETEDREIAFALAWKEQNRE